MAHTESNIKCETCNELIIQKDLETSNFTITNDQYQHKACPKELSFLWKKHFVSTKSHSNQSSNGSAMKAIEMALRLHSGQKSSVSLINDISQFASSYHSTHSVAVSKILNNITRYNSTFTFLDSIQCNVGEINKSVAKLGSLSNYTQDTVTCIITSLNNTNMIALLHKSYTSKQYIFYQSQPQNNKELNGAHILIFTDPVLLNFYLEEIFCMDALNEYKADFMQIDKTKNHGIDILRTNIRNIDYGVLNSQLKQICIEYKKIRIKKRNMAPHCIVPTAITKDKVTINVWLKKSATENIAFYIYQCNKKNSTILAEYEITKGERECVEQISLNAIDDLSMFEIALYPKKNGNKYVSNKLKISVPNVSHVDDEYTPNSVLLSSIKAIELNEEKNENIYVYFEMPDKICGDPIGFKVKYINNDNDSKQEYMSNPLIIPKSAIPISFQIITSANINGKEYLSKPSDIITIDYMSTGDTYSPNKLVYCNTDHILSILTHFLNDDTLVSYKNQIAKYIKSNDINGETLLKIGRKQFVQNVINFCRTKNVHEEAIKVYNFIGNSMEEKESESIYKEMLQHKKSITKKERKQIENWLLQEDKSIKESQKINESLMRDCISLHWFDSNDIFHKIKYWLYNDVEYRKNLQNVIDVFVEWSLCGKQILWLPMKNIQILFRRTLFKFITEETLNIIFEQLRVWKSNDSNVLTSKNAWEVGSIVYNYPLVRLGLIINDENGLIHGKKYIQLYNENKKWIQSVTGWTESNIYQINWMLFKHHTLTREEIEQRMKNIFPTFVGKPLALHLKNYLLSNYDVEVLHYELKNGVDLSGILKTVQDALFSNNYDEKQSDEYIHIFNDLDLKICAAVRNCFALTEDNIEMQSEYTLTHMEWICCNCSNRNFSSYIDGRISCTLSYCTLCGVSQKESIFNNKLSGEIIDNKNEKKDQTKDDLDEIDQIIEKVIKEGDFDVKCPLRADTTSCPDIIRLCRQLIIHQRWCLGENVMQYISGNTQNVSENKQDIDDIFQDININDDMLENSLFDRMNSNFSRLYTSILEYIEPDIAESNIATSNTVKSDTTECNNDQYVLNISIQDIIASYQHILTTHLQTNDILRKQNVFNCFEAVVHFKSGILKENCIEIVSNYESNQQNKTIETVKSADLKEYYISHLLSSIHLHLAHHQKKDNIVDKSRNKTDNELEMFDFGISVCPPELSPKYLYFKEEMIFNKEYAVTSKMFSSLMSEAQQKHRVEMEQDKKLLCSYFDKRYNIIRNEPIEVRHILALILYTNISQLWSVVDNIHSTTGTVVQYQELYNFMRNLFESVEFFGTEMSSAYKTYVAIGREIIVEQFTAIFYRPMLGAQSLNDAACTLFASGGNGIILILKPVHHAEPPKYFPTNKLSAFTGSDKVLIYAATGLLQITNIVETSTMRRHYLELDMFNKFQMMLENEVVVWSEWDKNMIDALSMLIQGHSGKRKPKNEYVTEFGKKLFEAYCKNTNLVKIAIRNVTAMSRQLYSALFMSKIQGSSKISFVQTVKLFSHLTTITFTDLDMNYLQKYSQQYVDAILEYVDIRHRMKATMTLTKVILESSMQKTIILEIDKNLKKFERTNQNKLAHVNWKIEYTTDSSKHVLIFTEIPKGIEQTMMETMWNQLESELKISSTVDKELKSKCIPLHNFSHQQILNKIKAWLYSDIKYRNNLKKIMLLFMELSLSGDSINIEWHKMKETLQNKTSTFMTQETFEIVEKYMSENVRLKAATIKTKTAAEIAYSIYNYPSRLLFEAIMDPNMPVTGNVFIERYRDKDSWMERITGWSKTDIYQINAMLFKCNTFRELGIKRIIDNVFIDQFGIDMANTIKEHILSYYQWTKLHYKIKKGHDIQQLGESLSRMIDTISGDEKQHQNEKTKLEVYEAIVNCFTRSFAANDQTNYSLDSAEEWTCSNCTNYNFCNYIGGQINYDLKICTLCGISQKDSLLGMLKGHDTYIRVRNDNKNESADSITLDRVQVLVHEVLNEQPFDLICPTRADCEPCPAVLRLAERLLIHNEWLKILHKTDRNIIQIDIALSMMPEDVFSNIFMESLETVADINDENSKCFNLALQMNALNKDKFLQWNEQQFERFVKKK
eukprot:331050_1